MNTLQAFGKSWSTSDVGAQEMSSGNEKTFRSFYCCRFLFPPNMAVTYSTDGV